MSCQQGDSSRLLTVACPPPAASIPGGLPESGKGSPRGFPCRRTKGASSSSGGTSRSWLSLRSSRARSGRWARPVGTEVRRLLCRTRNRKERSSAVGRRRLRASRGLLRATPTPSARPGRDAQAGASREAVSVTTHGCALRAGHPSREPGRPGQWRQRRATLDEWRRKGGPSPCAQGPGGRGCEGPSRQVPGAGEEDATGAHQGRLGGSAAGWRRG